MDPRTVLVVAPTRPLAATLSRWLTDAGHDVVVVTSFPDAKAALERGPGMVISEVRLGDYNGLHLVIRACAHGIPSLVIGQPDPVLEREAQRLGSRYLCMDVDRGELIRSVDLRRSNAAPRCAIAANLSFVSGSGIPSLGDVALALFARQSGLRPMPS